MSQLSTPSHAETEETLRAVASAPARGDARGAALRGGVLRRPGQGHVAGVCAALATGGGLPVRLVRLVALLLLALGVGLPLYVAAMLILPRPAPSEPMRGRLRRGDGLLLLALLPATALGILWLVLLTRAFPSALWVVLPVLALLVAVLAIAAVRARRARTTYLMARLAERAGILDAGELERTVDSLRRSAPRAWDGMREERVETAPVRPAPAGSRAVRTTSRARPLGRRATLVSVATLLIVGTAVFTAVSSAPGLAPGFADAEPLPGIGRTGAACAAVTVGAGLALMLIGWRRRRSLAIALIGVLAFSGLAASVVWVRLTDSSTAAPITVAFDTYRSGDYVACPRENPRQWSRTTVLDLSALSAPTGSGTDGAMNIECDRPVGDLEVILPANVPVASALTTGLGDVRGAVPAQRSVLATGDVVVNLTGNLGVGDIVYREAPA